MRFIKTATAFIIFNILISLVTLPLLLSFGPFGQLRDLALQTLIETRRGPMILSAFMSQEAMDKLKKESTPDDKNAKDTKALKFDNRKNDSSIMVKKLETNKFVGYIMLISDPTRVKVVASDKIGESGQRVSDMAKRVNAVGAINGGGFIDLGWQGNGGVPVGITISDGKVISSDGGDYVTGLNDIGALMIGKYNYEEVKRLKINNCLSFPGPVLVRNGVPLNVGNGGLNPRTAIGQTEKGEIIFLVVDGRSFKSQGASYKDLQDIMMEYKAVNAINLDGGSSTTMYYEGEVINNPGNLMGERYVPTAFVVMP